MTEIICVQYYLLIIYSTNYFNNLKSLGIMHIQAKLSLP
jgi:hypothetical protein